MAQSVTYLQTSRSSAGTKSYGLFTRAEVWNKFVNCQYQQC